MRKITLLVAALVAFTFSNNAEAQEIYGQVADGTSGIVSDYFEDQVAGAYSADDFQLTDSQDIYHVDVTGFQGNGATDLVTTLASGFNLYIYIDNAGVPLGDPTTPGTGILEIIDMPITDPALTITEDGTTFIFTVDIVAATGAPLTLPAGNYWISAFPNVNTTLGSGERWNWYVSSEITYTDAVLIDPSNLFGASATSWTPIENLTGDPIFDALAFTIYDENLGVIEQNAPAQISLYPNPVQDRLNIGLPASVQLESATLYDLLGKEKQVSISKNTMDMSQMASGVYILKLETSEGTLTKKVIKN